MDIVRQELDPFHYRQNIFLICTTHRQQEKTQPLNQPSNKISFHFPSSHLPKGERGGFYKQANEREFYGARLKLQLPQNGFYSSFLKSSKSIVSPTACSPRISLRISFRRISLHFDKKNRTQFTQARRLYLDAVLAYRFLSVRPTDRILFIYLTWLVAAGNNQKLMDLQQ